MNSRDILMQMDLLYKSRAINLHAMLTVGTPIVMLDNGYAINGEYRINKKFFCGSKGIMSASELNELLDDYIHTRKVEVCDAILQCAEYLFKLKDCLKLQ